jgi:hypothetical protein
MILGKIHDPHKYDNDPELLARDQNTCIAWAVGVGTIITIIYFTIGGGST